MKLFVCVVLLYASQAWCETDNEDCQFTVGDKNIKYDLSALVNRGNEPYQVQDTIDKNTRHTYYFNFCNNIAPPTNACIYTHGTVNSWGKAAPKNQCDPKELEGDKSCQAPVFQAVGKDVCYRLGKKFKTDQKPEASFIDPKDPSKGVIITYTDGDQCGMKEVKDKDNKKKMVPRFRKFQVRLMCDQEDQGANVPDDEPLIEEPTCVYTLTLKTTYGCPVSCGTVNGKTCNDNGECGYDPKRKVAQCFCKSGFYGPTCSDTTIWTPGDTSAIAFLSILLVALLGAVGTFTVLVWRRVKGLRLDPEAYSSMGGDMGMKTEDMDSVDEDDDFDGKDDV